MKANSNSKFNLEKFMKGAIAKTAGGQTAKFAAISRGRLIVTYRSLWGIESQETYQLDGRKYKNSEHPFDLIEMV